VIFSLELALLGLVQAAIPGNAAPDSGAPALVVVALPENANQAILEALNRLRGEAISVGFEVRLVDAATEAASLAQAGSLWAGLRPAAVVAFARPDDSVQAPHSLDVTFLDRASGKTSVAHLTAGDVADAQERADVIIAVRAVDFIRARMFDTLVGRRVAPAPSPPPREDTRVRPYHLAAGVSVLGTPSGFTPSLAARIAVGYRPAKWLRVGASALGLGSKPQRESRVGKVSLDQRFLGLDLTLLGREWHRWQPMVELGGGEYWVVVQGEPTSPNVGKTVTLASPGAAASVGLALHILPYLALELRGGTLWLQSQVQVRVQGTDDTYLGSLGRPIWLGSVGLGASF
jgi:hypothetical protein